ncbi:MAG TPA: hypothetical protein PKY81_16205 [bacterium]|nr:hypothetical protein [bacterium]HPN32496.1 hypothetical protein [bacterium]
MKYAFFLIFFFLQFSFSVIASEPEIDEAALFSDPQRIDNSILDSADTDLKKINLPSISDKILKSFSGNITSISDFNVKRGFADKSKYGDKNTYSIIKANLLFDVRMESDIKATINAEIFYSPQDDSYLQTQKISGQDLGKYYNHYVINEFFIDANINRKIYFRIGKQFLQWGRCYFWNPTDLINKERRNFSDLDKMREGVFGLKTHIPFGTEKNIYAFIDFSNEDNSKNFAAALKYEILIKNVEVAFSVWGKEKRDAAYGFDFSGNFFGINTVGELSFSSGDSKQKFELKNLQTKNMSDKNSLRCSLGLNKYFNCVTNDRIFTNLELYYNKNGYDDNAFKPEFWQIPDLYEPNNHGKYYAAFFGSFDRFIISNMNLNLNSIINLSDNSFMISPGLNYNPFYNFSVDFNVFANFGKENREYTLSGNAVVFELRTNLVF